jgi:hypothetical protein
MQLVLTLVFLAVYIAGAPLDVDQIVPEVSLATVGYKTGEHHSTASRVQLAGFDLQNAKIKTGNNQFELSYADALAFCGDYYGGVEDISNVYDSADVSASGDASKDVQEAAKKSFLEGAWKCLITDPRDPRRYYRAGDMGATGLASDGVLYPREGTWHSHPQILITLWRTLMFLSKHKEVQAHSKHTVQGMWRRASMLGVMGRKVLPWRWS